MCSRDECCELNEGLDFEKASITLLLYLSTCGGLGFNDDDDDKVNSTHTHTDKVKATPKFTVGYKIIK